jgi:signal transduction histidine kinase
MDNLQQEAPNRLVSVRIAPGLKANADPTLARRLMEALVRNAWKFTSESESAEIAVFRAGPDFVIEDNGIGFRQADKETIFLPGARLHPPVRFPGAGFGLAVARRIVERHGGTIHADGILGKGARFSFCFGIEG